ncbi:hypothetical protein FS842_004689 [Serendipita sp. 407]|nr:hypothetical protein FS842_004689 [Serendipita sp. 407]
MEDALVMEEQSACAFLGCHVRNMTANGSIMLVLERQTTSNAAITYHVMKEQEPAVGPTSVPAKPLRSLAFALVRMRSSAASRIY